MVRNPSESYFRHRQIVFSSDLVDKTKRPEVWFLPVPVSGLNNMTDVDGTRIAYLFR